MTFSLSDLERAAKQREDLLEIHKQRQENEKRWLEKGEKILERSDVNFPDINGFTLLDYAVILADISKIKELIVSGAKSDKAVALAMRGNVEKVLIAFSIDKVEQNSQSKPESFEKFSLDEKENKINEYNSGGFTPLLLAVNQGNAPYIHYLVEQGCDINKMHKAAPITAMNIALIKGDLEVVKYLFANGAYLDKTDSQGKSALINAIESNNENLVNYLLSQKINYPIADCYGRTAVHYAAESKNINIIKAILESEHAKLFKDTIDIFGRDPLQIALNKDNQNFINLISPTLDPKREKKEDVRIEQDYILSKLKYYLKLTNQDPNVLPDGGHCNGLAYLALLYSDRGKRSDFFNILKTISRWDGTYKELENAKLVEGITENYGSPANLFREFTDHVIIMMQSYLDPEIQILIPTQKSRVEQHELIGRVDDKISVNRHFSLLSDDLLKVNHHHLNESQLTEYISILGKLPGSKVEIGGGQHATSLYVNNKSRLDFYDPNEIYEIPIFNSPSTLAKTIKELKYAALGLDTNSMPINIIAHQSKDFSKDTYSFFKNSEIPKKQEDVEKFQNISPNKFTQLHIAVLTDSILDVAKILSNPLLDINAKDTNNDTPIDLAIKYNKSDIALAISKSPNFVIEKSNALMMLYENNKNDLLNILINEHDFKDSQGLLLRSIIDKKYDLTEKLLQKGVSPDEDSKILVMTGSNNPLFNAMHNKDLNSFDILIKHGANLEAVFSNNVILQHEPILEYLLNHHLTDTLKIINKKNNNDLLNQLLNSNTEKLSPVYQKLLLELVKETTNIEQQNPQGLMPVHILINQNHSKELYDAFSGRNIDLNVKSQSGDTPLLFGLKKNQFEFFNFEAISWLLKQGADVNMLDSNEVSPLMYAIVNHNQPDLIKTLLDSGADINYQFTKNGNTALHFAILMNKPELVKILLEQGAGTNILNKENASALDLAKNNKNEDIIKLFSLQEEKLYQKTAEPVFLMFHKDEPELPIHTKIKKNKSPPKM